MSEFAERSLAFLSRKREDRIVELERRISRYDDAIRLLRECTEWAGRVQIPGIDWWDVQIDEGTMEEALAFLAAEPKEGKVAG